MTPGAVRPGSTLKYSNKIDHQDPKLSKTTIADYGDRETTPYTQTYTTDGTPVKSSDREGDQTTTTVKWEGGTLVFETGEKDKAGSLDRESGGLVRLVEDRVDLDELERVE